MQNKEILKTYLIFLNQQHITEKGTVARLRASSPWRGRLDTNLKFPAENDKVIRMFMGTI